MYITYFVLITMRFNLVEMSGFDGLFSKVEKKLMLMFYLFNGTNFLKYIYSFKDTRVNIYIVYFYGLVIVIGMILNLTSRENVFVKKYKKVYFFILLILLLEVIQIIVTKKATAPWHTFTLYPFFTLLLVHSMFSIYHTIVDSKKIFATMLLVAFVSLTMLYQLYILSVYFKVLGTTTRNIAWSNKIYELIDYTSKSNKKFVSLDWGLHTPLITFDNKENKYFEWCFILNEELNEDNIKELKSLFLQDSSMLYITHGTDEQVFPKTLDRIIKLAGEFGFDLIREKTFKDGDRDIYVVYSLRKKA